MNSPKQNHMRIGMGCWAIGGPFWDGEVPLGYSGTNDTDSRQAIEASWTNGVRLFDTSAAYGAGHSESLLGDVIGNRSDAIIVSKFGHSIDTKSKQMTGPRFEPDYIRWSVEQSLKRLRRDKIDIMLLHLNDLSVEDAGPVFETLADIREAGQIAAFGWSTDFPDKLSRFADIEGFEAVQYAMNVFSSAPAMCQCVEQHDLLGMIRSPLAMGILTGKYSNGAKVAADDNRSVDVDWRSFFENGGISKSHAKKLDAVRDLLTCDGRSLTQGAICWLLAKSTHCFPIPGAKNALQAEENAMAMNFGPLPSATMEEIEIVLNRPQ